VVTHDKTGGCFSTDQGGGKRRGGVEESQYGLLHPHDAQSGVKVYVDV
jgi:hypothetical protein